MTSTTIHTQSAAFVQKRPEIQPGYTVRVHERIQEEEAEKSRIQLFEGLVIAVHRGPTPTSTTFTVRRIASGVGVERVFALHSPLIERIDVKKVAAVRRSKLYFLRGRRGKEARMSERFTTSDEFSIALTQEPAAEAPVGTEEGSEEKNTDKE